MRLRATRLPSSGGARSLLASASLNLDFLNSETLDPRITFARASNATRFNSAGNLVYAPNNWVRNNTMVNAAAGTPGTLPTNWFVTGPAAAGLTQTVVGVGVVNGITYIDLRFDGTPAAGALSIVFDSPSASASTGQTWAESAFIAVVGGTTANVSSPLLRWDEGNPSYLRTATAVSIGTLTSSLTRYSGAATIGASTTVINSIYFQVTCAAAPVDITLRIGLPQLEIGPTANAAIPTSGTAYNGPRLDYDPVTLAPRGLLLEEARTNRIANTVATAGVTLSSGSTTGPDGQPMTKAVVGSGAVTFPQIGGGAGNAQSLSLTAGQTVDVALSGYFAAGTSGMAVEPRLIADFRTAPSSNMVYAELQINTSNWTVRSKSLGADITEVSAPTIAQVRTGVYRVTWVVRYTQGATIRDATGAYVQVRDTAGAGTFTGDGVGHFQYFGLQGETGSTATSYIPATTTAMTRNTDVASVPVGPWFNATEGTLYGEATFTNTASFNTVAALSDGTTGNSMRTIQWNDGTDRIWTISNAGLSQALYTGVGQVGTAKFAGAYKLNDVNASKNGSIGTTDTAATIPTINALWLGATGSSLFLLNGHLRRVTYWTRRRPNSELQTITL